MSVALEARNVTKRYGLHVAVDDVSFVAPAGGILGVLGRNGAGKTTLIRMLTTVLAPTAGSYTVAGALSSRPFAIRRAIGVLPERCGYPGAQTGAEYLRYQARLYGDSRAAARTTAASLLERVGLAERGTSSIATYSRGMRQRLGIARALVNRPRVVFLDEPTLGLDPPGQRQVLDLVRHVAGEDGATVLVSTHLLSEVEEVCSHVIILDRGRLAAEGTVDAVAARAAARRRASLRVPANDVERALQVLRRARGIVAADPVSAPGALTVTLESTTSSASMNEGLGALAETGVRVLFFELEGARLSDAFLELTEAA